MQSNTQMRLGGSRMNYSTQAMSGMWSKAYAQSQLMSFVPQVSTMQAPGAHSRKPKTKRSRPKKTRRVSFSNDVPGVTEEEPITTSENNRKVAEDPEVTEDPKVTEDPEVTEDLEVIHNVELTDDPIATEEHGDL